MKRKIFISINIPDRAKKQLARKIEPWKDLPIKWTKEANLHITLFFLGHIDDDTTAAICQKIKNLAGAEEVFDLELSEIRLAPNSKNPQMVWLMGEADENLRRLHEKIEKALDIFVSEKKAFRPHITLGRIRKRKWEELEPKPEIFAKFPLSVSVDSVDVMASDFENGGVEYAVIESCPLA